MEERILHELSERQKELNREKEVLQSIRKQKMELLDELRNIQGKTVNMYEIVVSTSGVDRCQKNEAAQDERVGDAARKLERTRETLLEAAKKRKTVEILKERALEKHRAETDLQQRNAMDEMVIARHGRRVQE